MTAKRPTDILIGNSPTFPSPGVGSLVGTYVLTAGELVAVRPNRSITASLVPEDRYFYFAQYDLDYQARFSLPIYKSKIINAWSKAFTAPVAKVVTLNLAPMPVPAIGQLYEFKIATVSKVIRPWGQQYQVKSSTATIAGLTAQIAATINADSYRLVNAIATPTTVTFTQRYTDIVRDVVDFFVILTDGFIGAPLPTTTTPMVYGAGTYNEILDLEDEYKGYKGHLNRIWMPDSPTYYASQTVAPANFSAGYGTLTIEHDEPHHQQEVNTEKQAPVVTIVCVPNANLAALVTLFETVSGRSVYDFALLESPNVNP